MGFRDAKSWRVMRDDAGDHYMYFDASTECPATRELTEAEKIARLDKLGSVRGMVRSDQLELEDGCDGPRESLEGLLPF